VSANDITRDDGLRVTARGAPICGARFEKQLFRFGMAGWVLRSGQDRGGLMRTTQGATGQQPVRRRHGLCMRVRGRIAMELWAG